MYRAAHWQELERDASEASPLPMQVHASSVSAEESIVDVAAGAPGGEIIATDARGGFPSDACGERSSFARVLFWRLQTDLERVRMIPVSRSGAAGAGGDAGTRPSSTTIGRGVSPSRSSREACCSSRGVGGKRQQQQQQKGVKVPIDVPRKHLVEVTSLVAGLVYVILQASTSAPSSLGENIRDGDDGRVPGALSPAGVNPQPIRQENGTSTDDLDGVLATSATIVAPGVGPAESEGASMDKSAARHPREAAAAVVAAAAAAEWLVGEASRRLFAHEFTETFKLVGWSN